MKYFLSFLYATGATLGCSFVFNTDRRDIPVAALVGGLGWLIFTLVRDSGSLVMAYFIGSFTVALISEILAYIIHNPATVYLLPGLLPLVPGGGMFQTMEAAVSGDMDQALSLGFSTISAAGAIALGIALASSLARLYSIVKRQKLKIKKESENKKA